MIEKRVVLLFVSFLILLSFISAAENSANLTGFDKSYACLKEQISSKGYSTLTTEELAFSLMALGYDSSQQSKLKSELENQGSNGECWPKSSCTIKETSLVLFAYNHINENTKKIESWLMNRTSTPIDLVWYLQIDTNEKSECTITYENSSKKVTVNEDKRITGSAGSCFASAYNGFWLEVRSNCYDKEFEISCDKDFLTALIYKKKSASTYYVSTNTNTAAPGGRTTEKVESLCFSQANSCTYEGSLWATLALQKSSKDIKKFLPYLMTLSSENKKYLPQSFLYSLTGFDEYYSELINEQNKLGYWQMSDTSKRYYDTALALLSLYGKSTEPGQKAADYLLDSKVQGNGCWGNSVRDTAFVVYAAAPKPASSGGGNTRTQCSDYSSSGYSCLSSAECERINGTTLSNYACFGGQICCNKKISEKTCSQKNGEKCLSTEEDCVGGKFTTASDTSLCCIDGGTCERKTEPVSECQQASSANECSLSCSSNQVEKSTYQCLEAGLKCCAPAPKKSFWWVWLLVILIILLVLAIIFRNQLKIWFFKVKNKFSKSPVQTQTRPPFPPNPPGAMGIMPRRIIPMAGRPMPMGRPMQRSMQKPFPKDKELDETLKKLRDMSK